MAVDPSFILAGLQPFRLKSPQERLAEQLQLRAQQQDIETRNALEQERRQKVVKEQQAEQQAQQFGSALQSAYITGPDGVTRINRQLLIRNIPAPMVSVAIKFADETEKAEAELKEKALKSGADWTKLALDRNELLAAQAADINKRGNNPGLFSLAVDLHEKNGTLAPEEAAAIHQDVQQRGVDAVKDITAGWLARSTKRQELAKPIGVSPGEVLVDPLTHQPVFTGPPKPRTETEQALDAYAKSIGKTRAEELTDADRLAYETRKGKTASDLAFLQHTRERQYDIANPIPTKGKNQADLEQEYRTVLARGLSSRSGGLGLEDAKVQQANHLLALLDQNYDPNTDSYNIPKVMQTELALGLARLTSPNGQVGVELAKEINQRTAAGDLNGVLTYVTGKPFNGSTQAIYKMFKDSIERQGAVAEQNREGEMRYLRGLAPTELEEPRRQQLEANSLNPLRQTKVMVGPNGQRRVFVSLDGGKTWR